MKKSMRYVRKGEITLCTVEYENGLSHSAIGKHPDEREAQRLAYKALQAYVNGFTLEKLRAIRADVEHVRQQIRDGKFVRDIRVEVNGEPVTHEGD